MAPRRALEQARDDLAAGRAWKARDRLEGAVASNPADQEVLELLGDVHYRMGDLPAAGRWWYLTERAGPEVDAALDALQERTGGHAGALVTTLPFRPPLDQYPESVQRRLKELAAAAPTDWSARSKLRTLGVDPPVPERRGLGAALLAVAVLALVGPWVFGIGVAVWMVARALV
jgi:hypothetical protein